MTSKTFTHLICDAYGTIFKEDPPDRESASAQRKLAVKAGWYWKAKSSQDFCGECAPERRKNKSRHWGYTGRHV